MKKAICIKEEHDTFTYGFKLNNIYEYYKRNNNYFVKINDVHCGYDVKNFNEQFIDIRKLKLIKIKEQE